MNGRGRGGVGPTEEDGEGKKKYNQASQKEEMEQMGSLWEPMKQFNKNKNTTLTRCHLDEISINRRHESAAPPSVTS